MNRLPDGKSGYARPLYDFEKVRQCNPLKTVKTSQDFEPEVDFICRHFDFDVFVDVGPNRPFTEAWLVRQRKPACYIMGFEPLEASFIKLCAYSYPGQLFPKAICNKPVMLGTIDSNADTSNFCKIHDETDISPDNLIEVKAVSIDQILQSLGPGASAFVWADVEGSEIDVVMSACGSLENKKICGFMLELNTSLKKKTGCHWKEIVQAVGDFELYPIGIFNLQPTFFDCVFANLSNGPLWTADKLSSMLEKMMAQYAQDPASVPSFYTIDDVHSGLSFL